MMFFEDMNKLCGLGWMWWKNYTALCNALLTIQVDFFPHIVLLDMLFRWEAGSIGWNLLNSDKSYIQ
jgi:hypothetical protein